LRTLKKKQQEERKDRIFIGEAAETNPKNQQRNVDYFWNGTVENGATKGGDKPQKEERVLGDWEEKTSGGGKKEMVPNK